MQIALYWNLGNSILKKNLQNMTEHSGGLVFCLFDQSTNSFITFYFDCYIISSLCLLKFETLEVYVCAESRFTSVMI